MEYLRRYRNIHLLVLSFNIAFAIPLNSSNECILEIGISSSRVDSHCVMSNWNGFLDNCCGIPFKEYLHVLAKITNQTGEIFLNSVEQNGCLSSMKRIDKTVFNCGIKKLTSGIGGCSDYSVTDVNKLGNRLKSLGEDCKMLGSDGGSDQGSDGGSDQGCNRCLKRWQELSTSSSNSNDSTKVESDICRFAVLISVVSQRIYDDKWFLPIYNCLGNESLPLDMRSPASSENDQGNMGGRISGGLWILISGLAGITVAIIVALCILFRRNAKEVPKAKEVPDNSFSKESSSQTISIREVYSATNNLGAANFIGQGIAGKVYKGILSDGQHIAVKHIINGGQMDSFVREVKSLSHVKHPNLVSLVGHCDGKDKCFLVYELCQNGNLSHWLFGIKSLSWIRRLEIAIDCARGLWFLHTCPEGRIVHRDIKPTNILICHNLQGKLSDFGLSKVMNMGQSFVSSEARGTLGYVDPEYQKNHRVNASGDVYSFGIVLLQLLSGKRVINMDMHKPIHVNKMAMRKLRSVRFFIL